MYSNTEKLLDFLSKWTCQSELSFFGCVKTLTSKLAIAGFFHQSDVDLTKAWLTDLSRVGYREPTRKFAPRSSHDIVTSVTEGTESFETCENRTLHPHLIPRYDQTFVLFYPVEQEAPMLQPGALSSQLKSLQHVSIATGVCSFSELFSSASRITQASQSMDFFDDIMLNISFNFPDFYDNIQFLEAAYRSIFQNIVYCGPNRRNFEKVPRGMRSLQRLSFIEADVSCGYRAYVCTLQTLRIGYNVPGYLHTSDDALSNHGVLRARTKAKC
ncbi:hypothetical protein ElyMa_003402600 [Elysia marginata]|uniref:Uncharacterized protein n=1 Tax=Elysia marginata TaxID=1093978 RepID=A0AAV4JQC6_9GAST|nr:hypothetical protein ElyMa_003402600 [Elysia marginata]